LEEGVAVTAHGVPGKGITKGGTGFEAKEKNSPDSSLGDAQRGGKGENASYFWSTERGRQTEGKGDQESLSIGERTSRFKGERAST